MKKMTIAMFFLAFGLVGTLTFIGLQFQEDIKPYRSYENDLKESAQVYMDMNKPLLDVGESITLELTKLMEDKLITTDMVEEDKCTGHITIKKTFDGLEYIPYIECGDYKTNTE